jgi:hypothetical protein
VNRESREGCATIASFKGSKEDIEVVATSPPTGTVTFLFTDIEGSTKRWESHPEAMQSALVRHDEILRNAIEERGGYVFKTVGDAFCCAYHSAPDALEAALEAQRKLLSSECQEIGPFRVRMALHMGAAEERDGDYFGPPAPTSSPDSGVSIHTLSLCDPVIELLHRERFSASRVLYVGGYLRRKLGGEVGRLVARYALSEDLEGRTGSLLRFLGAGKICEVPNLGDKLISFHGMLPFLARSQGARLDHAANGRR